MRYGTLVRAPPASGRRFTQPPLPSRRSPEPKREREDATGRRTRELRARCRARTSAQTVAPNHLRDRAELAAAQNRVRIGRAARRARGRAGAPQPHPLPRRREGSESKRPGGGAAPSRLGRPPLPPRSASSFLGSVATVAAAPSSRPRLRGGEGVAHGRAATGPDLAPPRFSMAEQPPVRRRPPPLDPRMRGEGGDAGPARSGRRSSAGWHGPLSRRRGRSPLPGARSNGVLPLPPSVASGRAPPWSITAKARRRARGVPSRATPRRRLIFPRAGRLLGFPADEVGGRGGGERGKEREGEGNRGRRGKKINDKWAPRMLVGME
jgi:hypothetical protein